MTAPPDARRVTPYDHPRRVWVEDGHVFVEAHDGGTLTMTPDVAIAMGRLLGEAGAESLINKVMEDHAPPAAEG